MAAALLLGAAARGSERPATAIAPGDVPSAALLERLGATVGRVDVYVQNIFDTGDPRESGWLYRTANQLHYRTREHTVRSQLLFGSGERFSAHKLAETERILRSRVYLNDAWAVPVHYDAATNVVDVAVTVRDVWTLNPTISGGRAGGSSGGRLGLIEENLFGLGSQLAASHSHDVDRSSDLVSYFDPNLRGSWWQLGATYASNSDGRVESLSLAEPFYSLETRAAPALSLYDGTSHVSRYSQGVVIDQFEEHHTLHQASYGWSKGLVDGWTRRFYAGLRYDQATFRAVPGTATTLTPPAERKFVYPWVGLQVIEDEYHKGENVFLVGRTEDLYLGRSLYAEAGYSTPSLGGHGRSVLVQANAQDGWAARSRDLVFLSGSVGGRLDDGALANLVATTSAQYFLRWSDLHVFYASLSGTTTHRADGDQELLLGGDTGLRGYPIRFQGGTTSAVATVEERLYTDWYPFRIARIAGVAFFDAGRTWGRDPAGVVPLGLLRDVGLGIRIGNNRSGLGNVVHIDLSYALDAPPGVRHVQVTIATKDRF